MYPYIVGILLPQPLNLLARLLLLPLGEIDENHVHARFEKLWIECQRPLEDDFGLLMITCFAQPFENAIYVTATERGIGQGKIGIELDCSLEVLDCRINIFARNCMVDELAHAVAPTQILLRGSPVGGGSFCQLYFLVGAKL